jgi:cytochrome c556
MVLSLKNKSAVIGILLLFIFCFVQCSTNTENKTVEKVNSDSTASCKSKPLNPNGDSELALLMRKMLRSSESLKEMIKQGNLPKEFPEEFLKIHTAKPTDSETKKASFDGYATNYLNNLQTLYNSPKAELTSNYNALIHSCASCHAEHCPGPLKTINNLKINLHDGK